MEEKEDMEMPLEMAAVAPKRQNFRETKMHWLSNSRFEIERWQRGCPLFDQLARKTDMVFLPECAKLGIRGIRLVLLSLICSYNSLPAGGAKKSSLFFFRIY